MAHHYVSVSQLNASVGRAFLNVSEKCSGGIIVWGSCYNEPTYLTRKGATYYLSTFSDDDWANEWLIENVDFYDEIFQITSQGLISIPKV